MADDQTAGTKRPCPVCSNAERGQGGYLICECPARLRLETGGEIAALRAENSYFRRLLNLHPTVPLSSQHEQLERNVTEVLTNAD